MRFGIREFINREVPEEITGMDPLRPEAVRSAGEELIARRRLAADGATSPGAQARAELS